jgi:hypothetical protein
MNRANYTTAAERRHLLAILAAPAVVRVMDAQAAHYGEQRDRTAPMPDQVATEAVIAAEYLLHAILARRERED